MKKTKVSVNYETLNYSNELVKALAHPLRLRIIEFIDKHKSINVNKIYNSLRIEQSITSQHLRILRLADIVKAQRDGKYIIYSINYEKVILANKAVQNFLKADLKWEAANQ